MSKVVRLGPVEAARRGDVARPVRVGLVGAGVFGGYHASKFAASGAARLVGAYDPDAAAATRLVSKVGEGEAFPSFEALADACDAIVVASPASTHAMVARKALEAGRHTLVEKPLALTGVEARALARLAADTGVVLQVGHQERLVFAAMGLMSTPERPRRIEAVRAGPRSPDGRCEDVSVVFDLMIHDLDLAAELFGGEASTASAYGRSAHTERLDEATAELVFPAGTARLTASRCAPARRRQMRIDYPSGRVEIDFLTREVINDTPFDIRVDVSETLPDPLKAADEAFLAAITGGAASPITGGVGARAAGLAELVETSAAVAVAA
ncbi:gfo/Idh/MocA family oxidoreductase [bacterium]|nr:gfo/Idh/MocA family oxidoreductase [bacterium]